MMQNSTHPDTVERRKMPLWVQLTIWGVLLVLLVILSLSLFHVQHPILSTGSSVPNFTLQLFDNYPYQGATQVKLSDLRGKVVVVNFWASWCVSCADEAAALQSAWDYYQPGVQVVFLGVGYTDVESKALDYLARFEITYPNGPDLGTRITPIFNCNIAMPETYIIDRRGILRYKQIGPFQSVAEIQLAIDPLLAEK
jgi:cytochrome c biogenesis protein CcmG/thiol:disulfide interchange protein DsbE